MKASHIVSVSGPYKGIAVYIEEMKSEGLDDDKRRFPICRTVAKRRIGSVRSLSVAPSGQGIAKLKEIEKEKESKKMEILFITSGQ